MANLNELEISDLIFKELVKRGYSTEGNTRVWNIANSRLWYITPEQAQAYLDLENSKDYQKDVIKKEIDLIEKNINEIIKQVNHSPLNIIDMGCGDGSKAFIFINHLRGKLKMKYCPVDVSSYMVQKALDKISKINAGEVVKFQWNISDFENIENISSLLRRGEFKKNFILLLGNTAGNFDINELLHETRNAMKEGDLLLIGNGLNNQNADEILKSYFNPEVNRFLIHVPLQLGLNKNEIEFGARFVNSRVEIYYTLKVKKDIALHNKKISFNAGDKLIIAYSYKYAEEEFMSYLKMYFGNVTLYTSDSYCLALCKK